MRNRPRSNKNREVFLVSLPYANHNLHLGHIIGTFIPSHVCFLHSKKRGRCPLYLSGLDCHGTGTYISALEQKIPYTKFISQKQTLFQKTLNTIGINLRYNFKTHSESHTSYVNNYIRANIDRFFVEEYPSYYCFNCELSLNDRFIQNQNKQYLEKLLEEKKTIDQDKLYCFFCKMKVSKKPIKGLFLRYSTDSLLDRLRKEQNVCETHKLITRNIMNGVRCSSFINEKLNCRNTYYVWIEALLSYKEQIDKLKSIANSEISCKYFFAKDNLYYHTIVYPSLIGVSDKISPLKTTNSYYMRHYCNFKGLKMSNSLKNIVTLDDFKGYNMDILRYALAKLDPYSKDIDISKELVQKYYLQYIKNYINLGKRLYGLSYKLKKNYKKSYKKDILENKDVQIQDLLIKYDKDLQKTDLKAALEVVQNYCSLLNTKISKLISDKSLDYLQYLKLKKDFCVLADLLYPFTPKTSNFLKKYVNSNTTNRYKLSYCIKTFKVQCTIRGRN